MTDDQVSEQVRAWLAANPPERGPEGPPGERGMDGAAGQDGRDGRDATDEQLAMQVKAWLAANPPAAGEAGTPGRAGERGIDGSNGQDGADGRDALEVDVLSGIDIERSYARRTYASHLGGIWVARQQTHGMEGWECIVNGYQSIEIDLEDERTLVVRSTFSDGRRVEKRHAVPMLIDRGVFKDGAGYQRGDGVTWGGSFWIAQVDKADSKPDAGNGQWRLAVKKGRDGKEGPPGRAERAPAPVKVTP
ncbi:hypothetical protein ASE45_06430 [Lysobacter sp. Root96]|nr:hypothetical protein ASE45_06430 [Lysobacter sp. Root96]